MRSLEQIAPSRALTGPWCNADWRLSALLEAVSFVTPALEAFFIRTVVAALRGNVVGPARHAALAFVREEARHSIAHRRFNGALLDHLVQPPPALGWIEAALGAATRRLSLPTRLRLVAVLEQASARVSARYLNRAPAWRFGCPYAQRLFALHAREELGHHAVIEALRPSAQPRRPMALLADALAWVAVGAGATLYIATAVPWIALRKWRRRPLPA